MSSKSVRPSASSHFSTAKRLSQHRVRLELGLLHKLGNARRVLSQQRLLRHAASLRTAKSALGAQGA